MTPDQPINFKEKLEERLKHLLYLGLKKITGEDRLEHLTTKRKTNNPKQDPTEPGVGFGGGE